MSPSSTDIEIRERAAINAREAALRAMRWCVAITFAVGLLGVYLGVRSGAAVENLCELQVEARLEAAAVKRDRIKILVPGPNLAERREGLLVEARTLERNAARARCAERYRLP